MPTHRADLLDADSLDASPDDPDEIHRRLR